MPTESGENSSKARVNSAGKVTAKSTKETRVMSTESGENASKAGVGSAREVTAKPTYEARVSSTKSGENSSESGVSSTKTRVESGEEARVSSSEARKGTTE